LLSRGSSCTIPSLFYLGTDTDTTACFLLSVQYDKNIRRIVDPPTLDAIMELSRDEEAYEFYYKNFLRLILPAQTFKNCIKQHPTSLSSKVDRHAQSINGASMSRTEDMVPFVTVAEETLGLFFLENYSEVWQAQLTQKKNSVTDVFPKYTTGKKNTLLAQKKKGVHVARGQRMSHDGTARWNELYLKVTEDRERTERKAWEQNLLEEMTTAALKGKKRPREAVAQTEPTKLKALFSMEK
jgi:hypothetical protein